MRSLLGTIVFLVLLIQTSSHSFAIESRSDREKTITPRVKKFYRSKRVRHYVSLGGKYVSDERGCSSKTAPKGLSSSKFIDFYTPGKSGNILN